MSPERIWPLNDGDPALIATKQARPGLRDDSSSVDGEVLAAVTIPASRHSATICSCPAAAGMPCGQEAGLHRLEVSRSACVEGFMEFALCRLWKAYRARPCKEFGC